MSLYPPESSSDHNSERVWLRRVRVLTQALIISCALNFGLLATFIYFVLKDRQQQVAFELRPVEEASSSLVSLPPSNEELLRAYSQTNFSDLLLHLENKELAEEGYMKRDLALATLVSFHHFNLERALGGLILQQRQISFRSLDGEQRVDLLIFPGLADYQYQAIIHYAKTEKWPFTSQGLFYEVKRSSTPRDKSLLESFYLTPEFHTVFTLFSRLNVSLDKETLTDLLADGEWNILRTFTDSQKQIQDLSPSRLRSFLLAYLNYKSKIAAKLLLTTDAEFILKRFDDAQIVFFFDILNEKTPELENLSKQLLTSARSDAVWKKAAARLYEFANEPFPETYDHNQALAKFTPEALPKPAAIPEPEIKPEPAPKALASADATKSPSAKETPPAGKTKNKKRSHIVEENETLWKIARKYRVSVDAIMKQNKLTSEKLRVGKQLEIPDSK